MQQKATYYPEFESLRGLAALLVVFYHFPTWNPQIHEFPLFRGGGMMVDLFFVLSGFVIHTAYADRIDNPRDLCKFQLLRFGRLYPIHVVFLVAYLCIEGARMFAAHHAGIASPNGELSRGGSWSAFVQQVFLLQGILPLGDAITFNAPAWSISVEFYVYLLFGLLTLLVKPRSWVIYLLIHGAAFAIIVAGLAGNSIWFVRGISGFFLGCAVSSLVQQTRIRIPGIVAELLIGALVANVCIDSPLQFTLLTWISAALIFCIARRDANPGILVKTLKRPWLLYLGSLSYTLYMGHSAVFWVTNQVARFVLRWPDKLVHGNFEPQAALIPAALYAALSTALVIATAAVLSRYVEIPARDYFRRVAHRYASHRVCPA